MVTRGKLSWSVPTPFRKGCVDDNKSPPINHYIVGNLFCDHHIAPWGDISNETDGSLELGLEDQGLRLELADPKLGANSYYTCS